MLDRTTILRRFLLWFGVAAVSAAPSFVLAMGEFDVAAMIVGVMMFVVALTAVSSTERFERIRRKRGVRVTLYIGYGVRVLASIIFPVGLFIDMWPGFLAVSIGEALFGTTTGFGGTLVITLVQGAFINTIIGLLMATTFPLVRALSRKDPPFGACIHCRYDLRGTPGTERCPECGRDPYEFRTAA